MNRYYLKDVKAKTGLTDEVIWKLIDDGIIKPIKERRGTKFIWAFSDNDICIIRSKQIDSFDGEIREIPCCPEYYADTNGNIYSYRLGILKMLTPAKDRYGYLYVSIKSKKSKLKTKTPRIHKLIALTYVQGYNDINNTVNHIDGDKLNNKPSNLEWLSIQENIKHARVNNLIKNIPAGNNHYLSKRTYVYDSDKIFFNVFESQRQACLALGLSTTTVNRAMLRGNFSIAVTSKIDGKKYYLSNN